MNLDRFTMISNKVVEFKSTFRTGEVLRLVETSIGTDPPAPKLDAGTAPIERKDVAVQTGGSPRHTSVTCDDIKLSNWLQKMYPLVDEELSAGVTESYDVNDNFSDTTERLIIRKHQELMLKRSNPTRSSETTHRLGRFYPDHHAIRSCQNPGNRCHTKRVSFTLILGKRVFRKILIPTFFYCALLS
ncbi:hypothetical protein RP20_CCG010859 [Aedes albopictus]|nr:hypothetical protein RP20_CCG010859 [Aedes albopictus]